MTNYDYEQTSSGSGGSLFVLGLTCGAVLGAAVALLLAPKPGAEIRQQVMESAEELRRKANAMYGGASDVVGDAVSRGRKAWDAGRQAFNEARPGNGHADGAI